MAKNKKKNIQIESFDEWLKREHGKDILISATDIVERKRNILPTILSLDIALSGGIPDGTTCLLSGKPKVGKTSICLHILKNAIELSRPAYYLDIERRCKSGLIKTVQNLKMDKLNIVRENEESFSADQWLNILERIIKQEKNAVIIVDSIAMLSTLMEQSENIKENKDMAGSSKLLSKFFRRMQHIIDKNNIIIIFISQLMTNRDPTSRSKWVEKGGMSIQYAVSVWINANWVKAWSPNSETNSPDGHDIQCKIITSALGKPFLPCSVPLRYGQGLDRSLDVINNAENLGLIQKAGAWYSIPSISEEKFQGIENLRLWLNNNSKYLDDIEKEIRNMVFINDD